MRPVSGYAAAIALATALLAACNHGPGGGTGVDGIRGVIVDPDGRPVQGALVRIYRQDAMPAATDTPAMAAGLHGLRWSAMDSTFTGPDGSFALNGRAQGRYNLVATATRGDSAYALLVDGVTAHDGREPETDTVRVTGTVRVQVTSEGNAANNATCYVTGTPFGADGDSTGTCLLAGLPPDVLHVEIHLPGHVPGSLGELQVLSGVSVDAGILELASSVEPLPPSQNFHLRNSTLALWTFNDTDSLGRFPDLGPHARHLPAPKGFELMSSPHGMAARFAGSRSVPLGQDGLHLEKEPILTYEARIKVENDPPVAPLDGHTTVLGTPGLNMLLWPDGRLQVETQRGDGTNWERYAPVTASGVIPPGEWVNLAVSANRNTGEVNAYVNGLAQQLYTTSIPPGNLLRGDTSSPFTVGDAGLDNLSLSFPGVLDEVRISAGGLHAPGPPPMVVDDPFAVTNPFAETPLMPTLEDSVRHFPLTPTTLALWTFNRKSGDNRCADLGPDRHHLPVGALQLAASGYGKAGVFKGERLVPHAAKELTLSRHSLLTYEARVWLDAYPPEGRHKGVATLLGAYAGLKMLVRHDGRLQVVAQRGDGTNWAWYAPASEAGAVPLGRWVDLAVSADRDNGKLYAFVDTVPLQLTIDRVPTGNLLRGTEFFPFTIGNDGQDNQPFPGRIDEVRVSRGLVRGTGPEPQVVPGFRP